MYIFVNKPADSFNNGVLGYFINYDQCAPFLLEPDKFKLTQNINQADGVAILYPLQDKGLPLLQYILKFLKIKNVFVLDIFHVAEGGAFDDNNIQEYVQTYKKHNIDLFYIHTRIGSNVGIGYDFLWNRQKAAFTDYSKCNLENTTWFHYSKQEMFELSPIQKKGKLKKFLAPNRVQHHPNMWNDRIFKRAALNYFLLREDGYIGNNGNNQILGIQGVQKDPSHRIHWEGFVPIANRFYTSSFVSIYVETLTFLQYGHNIRTVTEKTWNPLIKGHFILPYGYRGMIQDILDYGVILPDWIDYSYDNTDDHNRFNGYMRSVYNVLQLSTHQLLHHFNTDKWILEHNRNLFFEKPYDSLYDKTIGKIKGEV